MSEVGPGQHATGPKYVRARRNGEAKMARAEKQAERRTRIKAPPDPPLEVIRSPRRQAFDRIIDAAMAQVRSRWAVAGLSKTARQQAAVEKQLRLAYRASLKAPSRQPTKAPLDKPGRHRRRQIAAASRSRNR